MMRIWVGLRYKCQLSSEAPSGDLLSFFLSFSYSAAILLAVHSYFGP